MNFVALRNVYITAREPHSHSSPGWISFYTGCSILFHPNLAIAPNVPKSIQKIRYHNINKTCITVSVHELNDMQQITSLRTGTHHDSNQTQVGVLEQLGYFLVSLSWPIHLRQLLRQVFLQSFPCHFLKTRLVSMEAPGHSTWTHKIKESMHQCIRNMSVKNHETHRQTWFC